MAYFTIKNRRFTNGGFLNLPFALPYGIAAVLLINVLPTLQHKLLLQYILSFAVLGTVWTLAEAFVKGVSRHNAFERENRLIFFNNKSFYRGNGCGQFHCNYCAAVFFRINVHSAI